MMNQGKVFQDNAHGTIILPEYCCQIIDTPEFQRLRVIKQLGGAEYVYPGATHSRFAHCLGVCHLALKVISKLKNGMPVGVTIEDDEEKCVALAGLCHDLGHGPMSHKFEEVVRTVHSELTKREGDVHEEDCAEWTHEEASIHILKHLFKNIEEPEKESFLSKEQTIRMVGDFIRGMPTKVCACDDKKCGNGEKCGKLIKSETISVSEPEDLKSRWKHYEEKRFLYQIISNSDSGIDVDKWDYLRRDCLHLGFPNNFDQERVIPFMRVLKCKRKIPGSDPVETYEICFRDKVAKDLCKMFTNRWHIHDQACQHRVVKVVEQMFTDALVSYFMCNEGQDSTPNSFEEFPTIRKIIGPGNVPQYTAITDRILGKIEHSNRVDLQHAQEILDRINRRQLYTCIWSQEKDLKEGTEKADIKKELIKLKDTKYLTEENLVIIERRYDYGKGDTNPLEKDVFFYKKPRCPGELCTYTLKEREHEKPSNFPTRIRFRRFRVYSREVIKDEEVLQDLGRKIGLALGAHVKREEEQTPTAQKGGQKSAPALKGKRSASSSNEERDHEGKRVKSEIPRALTFSGVPGEGAEGAGALTQDLSPLLPPK